MLRTRMFLLIAVFLVLGSAFVSGCGDGPSRTTGTAPAPLNPVVVRPSLDRTAAWVGDSLTYSLEIVCSPGYDIVEDDLGRDRLPLEGLVVRAANTTRDARDDGVVVYRGRFELASFSPESERLRIGPLSIRYYRKDADGRINAQMPVGTVAVPEEDVALRSTLPESVGLALRVARTPALLPSLTRVLYPLGATLIALSLVTVALGLRGTIGRRPAATRTKGPMRPPSIDYRMALNEIRQLEDTAGPEALRHAFDRLDHLLRAFLAETDIHARSLTPDEIDSKPDAGGDVTPPRAVAQVLRDCERVRYGGPSQPPSRELLARALDQAEQVLVPASGAAR